MPKNPKEWTFKVYTSLFRSYLDQTIVSLFFVHSLIQGNATYEGYEETRFGGTFSREEFIRIQQLKGLKHNQIAYIISSLSGAGKGIGREVRGIDILDKYQSILREEGFDPSRLPTKPLKDQNLSNHLTRLVRRNVLRRNGQFYGFNRSFWGQLFTFKAFMKKMRSVKSRNTYSNGHVLVVKPSLGPEELGYSEIFDKGKLKQFKARVEEINRLNEFDPEKDDLDRQLNYVITRKYFQASYDVISDFIGFYKGKLEKWRWDRDELHLDSDDSSVAYERSLRFKIDKLLKYRFPTVIIDLDHFIYDQLDEDLRKKIMSGEVDPFWTPPFWL
jgi:hypothetical protein